MIGINLSLIWVIKGGQVQNRWGCLLMLSVVNPCIFPNDTAFTKSLHGFGGGNGPIHGQEMY